MKNCVFCKYYRFHPGYYGYSEYTPGCEADIGCYKQHWELDMYEDTDESYQRKMENAKTCKDYDPRD